MGCEKKKTDLIRDLLLKTVGKNPELFSYYVSIQEAKELLNSKLPCTKIDNEIIKPLKVLAEG